MTEPLFRYDMAELGRAAASFVSSLEGLTPALGLASDPAIWSELTLDWWAAAASPRARVDAASARVHLTEALHADVDWPAPRAVSRRGPFDLAHTSHPPFDAQAHPYGYAYWERALEAERLELLLAAQIRWGGGGRPAARFGRAMLAASDLTAVDARAKALFVATDAEAERRRLLDALGGLRLASWDTRPWLWVDVPWRVDWQEHGPAWGLLEG
ncbi:MAG TPA: hypothetical protein RMH99_26750 [Sandaracinaceae bacterium LLY-WYZ-13_1]|nr:hypothetical protein [Sandaracinaceae bacterium LLY-WYZ-13_1]